MEEEDVEETHKWHSTRMGEALGRNGWRVHGENKERRGGMVGELFVEATSLGIKDGKRMVDIGMQR